MNYLKTHCPAFLLKSPNEHWIMILFLGSKENGLCDSVLGQCTPIQDTWLKVGQCKLVVDRLIGRVVRSRAMYLTSIWRFLVVFSAFHPRPHPCGFVEIPIRKIDNRNTYEYFY